MSLASGAKLGPYEILSPLGAGGMGEVYRARDTRLDRTVAIKVLNSAVTANAEVKGRFEREARSISQLQHPHICTLFDIGKDEASDTDFLVMEYLEGETLAERLRRGALPLDQLVKIGSEIADALDKAHRAGIVHRDLKPGNIMLTKSGAKLLDFGLAKSAGMSAAAAAAPLLSAAMTMTSPSPQLSPLTTQGTIVGTVQYMAPEQIEGKEADARSDIFAFGTVLYEMATATRPFEGKSQLSVATAILEKDPEPIASRCPAAPEQLERIVATCLAKDPEQRFSSAHDIKLELQWLAAAPRPTAAPQKPQPSSRFILAAIALSIVFAGAAAAVSYWLLQTKPQIVRAVIPTPDKLELDATSDLAGPPVISPDGAAIAFVAHFAGEPRALWVRRISDNSAQRLEGTEDAIFPFWSPDSRMIAFFAKGKLNKISATGGPVLALANSTGARGGSWGKDDVILFEPDVQSPLMRVSAKGGEVKPATTIDTALHTTHRWPWFLPDGKHFLFLATNHNGGAREENGIYFGSLDSKETHRVLSSDSGAQYAGGYLLYHSQNALLAQPFDPSSGKLSGEPAVVLDKVAYDAGVWRTIFSVSQNGALIYQGGSAATGFELVWVDRSGKELGKVGERSAISSMRLSPDGKRLLVASGDPSADLWVYDLEHGSAPNRAPNRLTFETGGSVDNPSWSRDGKLAFYNVFPTGSGTNALSASSAATIYAKNADGSGAPRLVLQEEIPGPGQARPSALWPCLLPDGKTLLYIHRPGASGFSIYSAPLAGDAKPTPVVGPANPQGSIIQFQPSPDGRWIAYTSTETGRAEVFLVPYPNTSAGKWQISWQISSNGGQAPSSGGQAPLWRGDGKELYFFATDNRVYAMSFDGAGGQPHMGAPQPLFTVPNTAFNVFYDVAPDGKRFLLNRTPQQGSSPINLLLNWPEVLKK